MYGLLKPLYNENKQRVIESLYADSDAKTQFLIRATIAEALKDCPRLIESHGADWILCTLSAFHKSPDDTMRVYAAIMNHLDSFSFGMLTDNIKWREMSQVADCCLVGLSFFRGFLDYKYQHRAAPSPDYYAKVGSTAFQRLGYDTIGEDFNSWVFFIQNEMVLY